MLEYLKAAVQSKTIWGIVMIAIPAFSKAIGHDISAADAATIVGTVQQAVLADMAAAGVVLAIWGRTSAKGPLVAPKA